MFAPSADDSVHDPYQLSSICIVRNCLRMQFGKEMLVKCYFGEGANVAVKIGNARRFMRKIEDFGMVPAVSIGVLFFEEKVKSASRN